MTNLVKPIRGKVARVLSSRDVALNRGMVDGVEIGMVFKILSTVAPTVTDPDTGELIGSVEMEFEKTSVKVTSVQERLSLASTFRTRKVNVGGVGIRPATKLFEPPKWETQVETFETNEPDEAIFARDTIVKTGDLVVQVLETAGTDG